MQIFVQGQGTSSYDISPSISVTDLKDLISFRDGIPADNQVLTFAGHPLEDEKTLFEYDISASSTITLGVRLLGGINTNLYY